MKTAHRGLTESTVNVRAGEIVLQGDLAVPDEAIGVVVFAHGSGSSRRSPRNQFVARMLESDGFATLLLDLLTPHEERIDLLSHHLRFDVGLLADRLLDAIAWLETQPDTRALPLGIFGASTGAGAALVAAAQRPERITAVVSRGGRPDLARDYLPRVQAPTLLIVGSEDAPVIEMNERAMRRMTAPVDFEIVPGATHLFEEAGALETVAQLAGWWFTNAAVGRGLSVSARASSARTSSSVV